MDELLDAFNLFKVRHINYWMANGEENMKDNDKINFKRLDKLKDKCMEAEEAFINLLRKMASEANSSLAK